MRRTIHHAAARGWHRTSRRAFTFLEVMLVVMILGMAMAVVLPNMRPASRRTTLEQATRRVIGMMRYARATAIGSGQTIELYVDFEKNRFELRDPALEEERERQRRGLSRRRDDAALRPLLDLEDYVYVLGPDLSVREVATYEEQFENGGRAVRLAFYPDGRSSRCTLVLGAQRPAKDGEQIRHRLYTIEVYHATGLISSHAGGPRETQDVSATFEPLAGRRGAGARFDHLGTKP